MSKNTLNSLFSKESLFSLQGAAAATLIVPNVLGYLIGANFYPYEKWVAFGVAMLLALLTAAQRKGLPIRSSTAGSSNRTCPCKMPQQDFCRGLATCIEPPICEK
jgi:hypothetical protein